MRIYCAALTEGEQRRMARAADRLGRAVRGASAPDFVLFCFEPGAPLTVVPVSERRRAALSAASSPGELAELFAAVLSDWASEGCSPCGVSSDDVSDGGTVH